MLVKNENKNDNDNGGPSNLSNLSDPQQQQQQQQQQQPISSSTTTTSASESPSRSPPPLRIRLITLNIRYATSHPFKGELPWTLRLPPLTAQLLFHLQSHPTAILTLQEVLHGQLLSLLSALRTGPTTTASASSSTSTSTGNAPTSATSATITSATSSSPNPNSNWTYIGVGRDDGKKAGEYSPIFFRSDVWKVLEWRTVWLSETPDIPGRKGWDAACVRIVTMGVLELRDEFVDGNVSGSENVDVDVDVTERKGREKKRRIIRVLSTHFDDQGAISRRQSAKLIRQLLLSCSKTDLTTYGQALPILLGGDLNSPPSDDAYLTLNSAESPISDVKLRVEKERRFGNEFTFTGFRGKEGDLSVIDHLFCSKSNEEEGEVFKVEGYGVLENRFDGGVYLSDHRAVVADLVLL